MSLEKSRHRNAIDMAMAMAMKMKITILVERRKNVDGLRTNQIKSTDAIASPPMMIHVCDVRAQYKNRQVGIFHFFDRVCCIQMNNGNKTYRSSMKFMSTAKCI